MKSHTTISVAAMAALAISPVWADKQMDRSLPAIQATQPIAPAKQTPARLTPPVGQALPDITSQRGISIGGKFTPWGGSLHLTESDAFLTSNGQCAFNVSYDEINLGPVPTTPSFANRLRRDSTVISQQTAQSLNAGESKTIHTQAYLLPGDHVLSLSLDDDRRVPESNEGNNLFRIKLRLEAKCGGGLAQGQPDLVPILSHPMSGTVIVKNIGSAAAPPSKLGLKCVKAGHTGGGGGCPEAPGLAAYADPAFPDHVVINVPVLAPGAQHIHHLSFWPSLAFSAGTYHFKALADIGHALPESNELNNIGTSTLTK